MAKNKSNNKKNGFVSAEVETKPIVDAENAPEIETAVENKPAIAKKGTKAHVHSVELKMALESNENIHSVHYTADGGHSFNDKRSDREYAASYTREEVLNN